MNMKATASTIRLDLISKNLTATIKTASQGQISIAGQWNGEEGEVAEKPKEPYLQKARVVSTIVFFWE
ncbi:MAG: hypothetical protein RL596_533 [Bacteroidota bacterium]|jgi:uncharacterized protein